MKIFSDESAELMALITGMLTARMADDKDGAKQLLGGDEAGLFDDKKVFDCLIGMTDYCLAMIKFISTAIGITPEEFLATMGLVREQYS